MISQEQAIQNEAGAIKMELKEQQAWNTRTKQFYFPNGQKPKLHKHHFNPHTITGKIMDRTFETLRTHCINCKVFFVHGLPLIALSINTTMRTIHVMAQCFVPTLKAQMFD